MAQTKIKKLATKRTRTAKSANSPMPHSATSPRSVRYCGPTSHPSHHHAIVAAEGHRHVWAASVIAGLAIVLTAAIAFTAVQAETEQRSSIRDAQMRGDIIREIRTLNTRIGDLEDRIGR